MEGVWRWTLSRALTRVVLAVPAAGTVGLAVLTGATFGLSAAFCVTVSASVPVFAFTLWLSGIARAYASTDRDERPVRVEDGGLYAGHELLVPRAEVFRVTAFTRRDGRRVVRVLRAVDGGGFEDFGVEDERAARRLVQALGASPSERGADFDLPPSWLSSGSLKGALGMAALTVTAVLLAGLLDVLAAGAVVLGLLAVGRLLGEAFPPRWVRVGSDGFVVGGVVQYAFHRFAEVREVTVTPRGFRVTLQSGEDALAVFPGLGVGRRLQDEVRMAGAHLHEAWIQWSARSAPRPLAVLEPSEASGRAWGERLLAVARAGEAHYREDASPTGALWGVLEDPRQSATQRAGAAVALREDLDAAGRQRLRVALEAVADPGVRVVLDAVGRDADDVLVVQALDEVLKGRNR